MPRKTKSKKIGRPSKPIDWKIFEQLCNLQCTPEEISSFFHLSRPTLYERAEKEYSEPFPTVYKKFCEGGKCSLRRTQWKLAQKNAAMAIWLGKQILGQTDPDKRYDPPLNERTVADFEKVMRALESFQGSSPSSSSNNSLSPVIIEQASSLVSTTQ